MAAGRPSLRHHGALRHSTRWLVVAAVALLLRYVSSPWNFVSTRSATRMDRSVMPRQAGNPKGKAEGFADGNKKVTPRKKDAAEADGMRDLRSDGNDDGGKSIVKDKRQGVKGQLTRSKLADLRDKTLTLRQTREAEIDEYEMGKAMIAKYGRKVAIMPKVVEERVAKRGLVVSGSFYGTMLLVFAFGFLIYKTQGIIIPPTLMGFTTLGLVLFSIFGGAYAMMSASWDEDRAGSVLGTEEFSKNMGYVGDSIKKYINLPEYEKAVQQRMERRKLLEAKQQKKRELLNK
eukprot:TRINITY_DN88505_c0_g1_i1.p1 TRINITY_DN88505_c0_g1~~TRINITY_DN88505_c0_g1_i1.p1  ORF type:complete len:309 (+),score=66.96 TRINITY_DN88505_c0_g1_i1:61-927(+)